MGQAREVLEESETKELYLSCLTEMADEVISDMLIGAWSDPGLLEKWSGTPWHYKRLKKALEAAALDVLPEGSTVQINAYSEIWTTATVVAFCPVPGDTTELGTRLLNTYAPRPLMRRVDGVNTFHLWERINTRHASSRRSTSSWVSAAMSRKSSASATLRSRRRQRRPGRSARSARSG